VLGYERGGSLQPVRSPTIQARARAGEAFDAFLNERAASSLDPQTAGFLLSAGTQLMLAADLLEVISNRGGYQADSCPDGARAVHTQADRLRDRLIEFAEQLALSGPNHPSEPVAVEPLRRAAIDCLARWRTDDRAGRGAMAVVMAGEWVENLARLEDDLVRPVATAVEAARQPWWR
jgi:hypothetical protein